MLKIAKNTSQFLTRSSTRNISCTAQVFIDQKWREENGLTANPNGFGPLTNLPDYTYLDGRPAPIGSNLKKRLIIQQEMAVKIVTLSKELDMAKDRFKLLQQEKQEDRKKIMQDKLKPKGKFLLQKQK